MTQNTSPIPRRYTLELLERPDGSFHVSISNEIAHDDTNKLARALYRTAIQLHTGHREKLAGCHPDQHGENPVK